ncbi:MAG: hypothetical protein Q4C00_06575 [Bacillota bacterium]|nr:hypothetical protein [Bacillota bacterium]
MDKVKDSRLLKTFSLLLSIVFPIVFLMALCFDLDNGWIVNVLWCGLYGTIGVCVTNNLKALKVCIALLNFIPFCFLSLGFMMGGISAVLWLMLKAIIPFISVL